MHQRLGPGTIPGSLTRLARRRRPPEWSGTPHGKRLSSPFPSLATNSRGSTKRERLKGANRPAERARGRGAAFCAARRRLNGNIYIFPRHPEGTFCAPRLLLNLGGSPARLHYYSFMRARAEQLAGAHRRDCLPPVHPFGPSCCTPLPFVRGPPLLFLAFTRVFASLPPPPSEFCSRTGWWEVTA